VDGNKLRNDVLHDLYSTFLKKTEEEEMGGSCSTIGAIVLRTQFVRKTEQKRPRVEICTSIVGQDSSHYFTYGVWGSGVHLSG